MSESVQICLIDSDDARRARLADQFRELKLRFSEADDIVSGLDLVRKCRPKIICCGGGTPTGTRRPICEHIRTELGNSIPYLLLALNAEQAEKLDASPEHGADDSITVPCPPSQLMSRITLGLRTAQLRADLERATITDRLTGLFNHCHFTSLLETEFARSRRYGGSLSILMVDLDFFKAINDTFGHQVGNEVLKITADVLQKGVRDTDTVARYGGEEFAVVVPEAPLKAATEMAERLRAALAADVRCPELREQRITASFGVVSVDDPRAATPSDLVELADRALYLAKHSGRNRVCTSIEVKDVEENDDSRLTNEEVFSLRKQVVELSIQAREMFVQSVWALVQALEAKDPYTAYHSRNVTLYAEELARRLNLSGPLIQVIRHAAMLHDLGKIGLPDAVLMKTAPLNDDERQLLRRVPMITARILDRMRILETELQIIRHQREHYDGTGHPAGLVGDEIPIGSRILMVADAFDSMTTDRIYRPRRSIADALIEIERLSGKQFDPRIVVTLRKESTESDESWQARIDAATRHAKQSRPFELVC